MMKRTRDDASDSDDSMSHCTTGKEHVEKFNKRAEKKKSKNRSPLYDMYEGPAEQKHPDGREGVTFKCKRYLPYIEIALK